MPSKITTTLVNSNNNPNYHICDIIQHLYEYVVFNKNKEINFISDKFMYFIDYKSKYDHCIELIEARSYYKS